MGKIFGVDVGGTTIKIGMFGEDVTLEYKCEIPTNKQNKGVSILNDICDKLDDILRESGLKRKDIKGIGIGLPGPVTDDGRILGCVNLGWGTFNIEEKLSKMYDGILVKAGNDANLAALGEQRYGGGKGHSNIIMITLGTGVGGGIILDNNVLTGTNGAAGELGHIPVEPGEEDTCGCGKKGCLEQYGSASGIVRMTKKYIKETTIDSPLRQIENFSAKEVLDLAKEGDKLALKVAEQMGKYLGMALAATASVVNPDCMVIGGGVSKAGVFLIDIIEKNFLKQAFLPCRNVTFHLAKLGNDAGIYGGFCLIK